MAGNRCLPSRWSEWGVFIRRNLINTSAARRDATTWDTSESQERRELKSSLQSLNDRKLSRTAIKLSYKMSIKTLQDMQENEGQLSKHLGLAIRTARPIYFALERSNVQRKFS